MKRLPLILLCLLLTAAPVLALEPAPPEAVCIAAPSAILMEKTTGTVLYEKDACAHLSPASVTKLMTMLLVAEALDAGTLRPEDTVTASARAASMGGSQIWLEEGEEMTVDEMLKCVAVVSANDCCVALAEHLAGSEEAFVRRMNDRAEELGLTDTHFTSCSGLTDSDDHYSCARDLALISRELLLHPRIKTYTTVWMDSIRDGEFGLSNTNKLIYYYPGATGLKTGYTAKAGYCLSASAERDGIEFIAVVLHVPTSTERFESAKALLSFGFANYALLSPEGRVTLPPVPVTLGAAETVQPVLPEDCGVLTEKSAAAKPEFRWELPERIAAPVEAGEEIGTLSVYAGEALLREVPLLAGESVPRLGFFSRLRLLLNALWC